MHDNGARLSIKQFHAENLVVNDALPKFKSTDMSRGLADITTQCVEVMFGRTVLCIIVLY